MTDSTSKIKLRVYGVVFLIVVALLLSLTVAIYRKTFVPVVRVTLETSSVGNQLAPPADVKLRGIIVGEVRDVRADGDRAQVALALEPEMAPLIPDNVSARLLPKTLFGERYVNLVLPDEPSPRPIQEGDVIGQDRTSAGIEVERVLDDLLPLLRTVQPEKLNATLSALATALEGRGDALGDNLERVHGYVQELNPHLDTINTDIAELADVASLYDEAAPDLLELARNTVVTSETVVAKKDVIASFLADTAGFARTAREVVADNEDRLIRVAKVSQPTLELLARYSPEFPCLLEGLARAEPHLADAFHDGALNITLEVVLQRPPYRPGEEPNYGARIGPGCHGLPDPKVPAPDFKVNDGSRPVDYDEFALNLGLHGRPLSEALMDPTSGSAGTEEEQVIVNALLAPVMGVPVDEVPDLATLLFGPMARGTAVSVR